MEIVETGRQASERAEAMSEAEGIRTRNHPTCILCGREGTLLYSGLTDRLFGASGEWNSKICTNPECGLLWLDPMPLKEDLGKAYANYYTHEVSDSAQPRGLLRTIRSMAQRGYWANRYKYETDSTSFLARALGVLLRLSPIDRREADAGIRCLPAVPNGRLLDVGCGAGSWLLEMSRRGWTVEGCDFDGNAVRVASQKGLNVKCGSLDGQNYPSAYFDAVTLNHVIEHVPDPVHTLAECARILKPGGKLVLFTPNNASLGHRWFKKSWRGLEPPRHLHVFSIPSTRRALRLAGFQEMTVSPFIVTSVIYDSLLLRKGQAGLARDSRRNWPAWIMTRFFKILELCLLPCNPAFGDCVIAVAVKR